MRRVNSRFRAFIFDLISSDDGSPQTDAEVAARDVAAIIKGIVDTAGEHGETEHPGLAARVERAVFGYLSSR